jgi:hypothetical protein
MENKKQIAEDFINKALYDFEYNIEDYGFIAGLIIMAHKLQLLTDRERDLYISRLNRIKFENRKRASK